MVTLGKNVQNITKISQVTQEVTLFLRNLGFSNYYIIKIYDLVGDAAIALTEDNPYWLLEEFPRMGFAKVDEVAQKLGFDRENFHRLQAGVIYAMKYFLGNGHSFVPFKELETVASQLLSISSEYIMDVVEDLSFEGRLQLTNLDERPVVYPYYCYKAECEIVASLVALENAKDSISKVGNNLSAIIARAEAKADFKLSESQKNTVIEALKNAVSIITGGPGTGKTTIIRFLLSILEEGGSKRILVGAPTGRAAKRIMETSGHYASTIHRMLDYYYDEEVGQMVFGRNQQNPLDCSGIIIDEASMIDVSLMSALCNAIRPGTRLILVGDRNQLPSVGAGNVLADLIDSEYFYTANLKEIYRQSEESQIVLNAHRINKGDYPSFEGDFSLIKREKQQDILDEIVNIAKKYSMDKVQVLSPVKKGILGVSSLNQRLQEVFNPETEENKGLEFGKQVFRVGDRVMQTKNNYRLKWKSFNGVSKAPIKAPINEAPKAPINVPVNEAPKAPINAPVNEAPKAPINAPVNEAPKAPINGAIKDSFNGSLKGLKEGKGVFNGEIGVIKAIDYDMKAITVAYDEKWVEYPYVEIDEIQHAYAVTIHKSQGSEFPVVIIPISWFPPVLATRSLIYTAITRSREKVYVVGEEKYLKAMVDNNQSSSRYSGIKTRLEQLYMTLG